MTGVAPYKSKQGLQGRKLKLQGRQIDGRDKGDINFVHNRTPWGYGTSWICPPPPVCVCYMILKKKWNISKIIYILFIHQVTKTQTETEMKKAFCQMTGTNMIAHTVFIWALLIISTQGRTFKTSSDVCNGGTLYNPTDGK